MIEIKNVTFSYEDSGYDSLKNISLSIKRGECVLLCGKSGCGKTTITRLLNGMIPEYYSGHLTGSIDINGIDPVKAPMYEISKKVGTVFQNPKTQFYTVNTTSEIAFGCENHGMSPELIRERVKKAAGDLKLESLLDRNIFQLSGGGKQKIAFASIYALDPEVYILDEPSSNLDFFSVQDLKMILAFLKAQGKTIVLAEHRIWYLKDIADRAIYIEEGRIAAQYSMQDLSELSFEQRIKTGIRPVEIEKFQSARQKSLSSEHCIHFRNVKFYYKKERALDIEKADFKAGGIYAVIGRNGAGKSTFVSVLCGIFEKRKGNLFFDGVKADAKKRISYSYMVMQEVNHQLFTDSVAEEITLGVKNPSLSKLEGVLKQMDIEKLRERHPMTLSGGQKQRVAIAAAVFGDKKILVFDEPTSGLDFSHMVQTSKLLQGLKAQGVYIFVITHDYEFLISSCDHVIHIEDGKIKEQYILDDAGEKRLKDFFIP